VRASYGKGGISGEARLASLARASIRAGMLRGRIRGGGCIVITEFGVEGLHFLHADVVDCT